MNREDNCGPERDRNWSGIQEALGGPGLGKRVQTSPLPRPVCVLYFQGITYLRIPVADNPDVPM